MGVDTKKSRYVYQGPYSVGDTAPIPFKYIKAEHIEVYRDSMKLEYNVEYSITGQNVYLMTPIAAVESLVVLRNTKRDQDSEFPQEGKFDSAEVEEALDKLANEWLEESVYMIEQRAEIMNMVAMLTVSGIIAWAVFGTFDMQDQITSAMGK